MWGIEGVDYRHRIGVDYISEVAASVSDDQDEVLSFSREYFFVLCSFGVQIVKREYILSPWEFSGDLFFLGEDILDLFTGNVFSVRNVDQCVANESCQTSILHLHDLA